MQFGPPEPMTSSTLVNYRSVLDVAAQENVFDVLDMLGFKEMGEYAKQGFQADYQGIHIEIFQVYQVKSYYLLLFR